MMILIVSNSARNERRVVKEPAPAISGKAMGTMEAPEGESCLNSSMPNIISNAIITNTNEPAMANEEMSTPNKPKRASPTKRKIIRIVKATDVDRNAFIGPLFFFRSRMIGSEPKMSITANKTIKAEAISMKWICMVKGFNQS